nr:hypothetical protein [Tanacetum cinerariifolium]
MLLEGSELTKEDRESQLYDDFEHFRQHKGESIHSYYVRFSKLINDMRNIKMSMSRLQLNSKFVNNMLTEWGKQDDVENPLALMSNVSNPQHYSPSSSASSSTQVPQPLADSSLSPTEDLIENLTNTGQGMNPRGGNAAGYGELKPELGMSILNSEYYKDKMLLMQAQENRVALDAEQLLFLADDCDAFDSDVDEAPTAQTMFMANLSSADPVTNKARPSYDSNILSEVPDHDHYQDAACAQHEEHVMHDSVQLDHVVVTHADYTTDSNMITYDQYVKDNEEPVVHNDVSFVPNDAFMMIDNDMCKSHAQSISNPSWNTVVKNSLTAELATYKEHVELYEQQAKFELTKREQKINEQLRLVISDCNFKEETLKKELHSIKLQLASTINHHKSMVEEVTFLKNDFKQKENKYLEDFMDMKSLKEKVEDRLIKQDQSLQTVHMLCRPKLHSNELNRVAIGYKNPLCLTLHNTEDTLEIAEITRKKMNAKMNDPECVTRKVKIAPHDYSKENFLATFTPQKQLTPEQIFWSNDLMKLKFEALKERTKVSRPIKALTVYLPNTPATLVPKVLPT